MANKQNATLAGIAVLLVAVVASGGAFNSLLPGQDDGDSGEDGEFTMLDFNDYPVDVELKSDQISSGDTVYLVSADAEAPDNYGNHEADVSASDIESDFGNDAEVIASSDDAISSVNDGSLVISSDAIGENEDFQAGQEYRVFSDNADSAYTSFDTVTLPSEVEKFKYEQDSPSETLTVDFLQDATYSLDGTTTSSDGNDHEFERAVEVTDGTSVMGDINVSSVGADVTEVSVTVTADGEQVYSETSDGSEDGETIASALSEDLVEEDMGKNPVTAEESVTVAVEVDADGSSNSVTVDLNELDDGGISQASFTAP